MSTNPKMATDVDLFTPLEMGSLQLSNRIVLAPLTRNRAGEGNVPQDINAEYYRQRASGGLLISEASQISPQGVGYPATPGIHSDAQVAGWKKVTDAVHAEGGHIFLQCWHVGRISHPSLQPAGELPVAPSAIKPDGEAATYEGMQAFVTPRALNDYEIPMIADQYGQAARNAMTAGFDGVEIHAANGYLLDQFLRDGTNHRDDEYGGSLDNRFRFLKEVIEAVTAEVGNEHVGLRLSPENGFNDIKDSQPQDTFNFIVTQLNQFHLAYLHVVEGDMVTGERNLDYHQFRIAFKGLYMANNRYDFDLATKALASGAADLVSFGQLFLANPDLPERFAKGAELNEPDMNTFYGGDERGYTDYPTLE
jgi:N-ethylmaleimide reductase